MKQIRVPKKKRASAPGALQVAVEQLEQALARAQDGELAPAIRCTKAGLRVLEARQKTEKLKTRKKH